MKNSTFVLLVFLSGTIFDLHANDPRCRGISSGSVRHALQFELNQNYAAFYGSLDRFSRVSDNASFERAKSRAIGASNQLAFDINSRASGNDLYVLPMQDKYWGEHHAKSVSHVDSAIIRNRGVREYTTPQTRERLKLRVNDQGRLEDSEGYLFSTEDGGDFEMPFAMDSKGNLYVAERSDWNHSMILGGEPVACAGMIKVRNGKIRMINNDSGHYQPTDFFLRQATQSLKAQGVKFSANAIRPEKRGVTRTRLEVFEDLGIPREGHE